MFHCNYIMARCRLWSRLFEWSRLFDLVKQIVWCQWWDAMVVQTESDPFWWRHAWLPPPLRHQYQISSYNNWAIYMHMLNMMQATTIHIFISAGTCIYIYIYIFTVLLLIQVPEHIFLSARNSLQVTIHIYSLLQGMHVIVWA